MLELEPVEGQRTVGHPVADIRDEDGRPMTLALAMSAKARAAMPGFSRVLASRNKWVMAPTCASWQRLPRRLEGISRQLR